MIIGSEIRSYDKMTLNRTLNNINIQSNHKNKNEKIIIYTADVIFCSQVEKSFYRFVNRRKNMKTIIYS